MRKKLFNVGWTGKWSACYGILGLWWVWLDVSGYKSIFHIERFCVSLYRKRTDWRSQLLTLQCWLVIRRRQNLFLILKRSSDQQVVEVSLQENSSGFKVQSLTTLVDQKAAVPDYLTSIKTSSSVSVLAMRRMQIKCQNMWWYWTVYFSPILTDGAKELTFSESISQLKRGRTNNY